MKKNIFRGIYIFLFIIDFLFLLLILILREQKEYYIYNYFVLLLSSITLGIILIRRMVKSFSNEVSRVNIAFVISIILTIVNCSVFFMLLPKFSIENAYERVKRDPNYASQLVVTSRYSYPIKGNPFVRYGYVFLCETIDYRSRSFYLRTSEIQFDQVTGNHKVGLCVESIVDVDSLDIFGMDCVYFEKDKKAQINLHFILEPEKVLHGIETNFSYHYFNASFEQIKKNGILYTTMRRPDMDANDARDFINDVGKNKLKIQLEKYVSRFYSELGKDLPDFDLVEIKLYGVDIATYQNGCTVMKELK